jgi:hypothetical protein
MLDTRRFQDVEHGRVEQKTEASNGPVAMDIDVRIITTPGAAAMA